MEQHTAALAWAQAVETAPLEPDLAGRRLQPAKVQVRVVARLVVRQPVDVRQRRLCLWEGQQAALVLDARRDEVDSVAGGVGAVDEALGDVGVASAPEQRDGNGAAVRGGEQRSGLQRAGHVVGEVVWV